MNALRTTGRYPWPWRALRRAYLTARVRWLEQDITMYQMDMLLLPDHVRHIEKAVQAMRVEIALLDH